MKTNMIIEPDDPRFEVADEAAAAAIFAANEVIRRHFDDDETRGMMLAVAMARAIAGCATIDDRIPVSATAGTVQYLSPDERTKVIALMSQYEDEYNANPDFDRRPRHPRRR